MSLASGTRVGPYEVLGSLGAGGMGEVYRARDTKLGRDVALKILPDTFANDPERLARFEREAKTLASLNHPHIAQIYGFEQTAATSALVMELIEGEDLSQRIARSAIPLAQALPIATQIAEALEAAHEQGIVHRDLKPANIKIRDDGTVKVLDFGLAKALDPAIGAGADPMDSPTIGVHATAAGIILGTAAYMSPEQAKGRAVDKRTDLWAFGAVLYEMLTGRPAFRGDGASDTIARVIMEEPDWSALPAGTPGPIRTLLRRCLEKDRRRRLDSATAARFAIEDTLAAPAAGPMAIGASSRRVVLTAIATLAGAAALATWALMTMLRPPPQFPLASSRYAIVAQPAHPLATSDLDRDLAVSPDGRYIVYRTGGSPAGGPLMVRAIDQLDARPLAGVTNARQPFFSADSRWIGFLDGLELKKVLLTGGPAITLCRLNAPNPRGASWGDDNAIVFATNDAATGLLRVAADGGEPTVLTRPDAAQQEEDHLFPTVLPGGRGVLFTITATKDAKAQVAVLDLKTGMRTTLVLGASQAEYVVDPSTTSTGSGLAGSGQAGYLIYSAAGTLRAVRFNLARLEVVGDPMPVVERVMVASTGAANYTVSREGRLVYVPGGAGAQTTLRSLVWVDRKGNEAVIAAPLRAYNVPRVSPDGKRVAIEIRDQDNDIWIWDFVRQTLQRLTADPSLDQQPVWTPDGRHIIFASGRAGASALYRQAADGTGSVDRLTTSVKPLFPNSITPDGTRVVGYENSPTTGFDVVLYSLVGAPSAKVESLVQTTLVDLNAEVSPDGRYVAYQSNELGRFEIYVRPFPQIDGGRWQISTGGGTMPAWARGGRELFYLDSANRLTAVTVQTSGPFSAGNPIRIFDTQYAVPVLARPYDVSPDGQRFLMIKNSPAGDPNATPASMIVVEHWFEELKARAPRFLEVAELEGDPKAVLRSREAEVGGRFVASIVAERCADV